MKIFRTDKIPYSAKNCAQFPATPIFSRREIIFGIVLLPHCGFLFFAFNAPAAPVFLFYAQNKIYLKFQ